MITIIVDNTMTTAYLLKYNLTKTLTDEENRPILFRSMNSF